jgi:2-dehydro-3-deoxygluconokinase
MIRLSPSDGKRLVQAKMLELHAGGSESNTAATLSRLGYSVAWLSRLTDSPIGRWVEQELATHRVDTSHVLWTPDDRVGLYFYEPAGAPRGSQVHYDRRDSAMARTTPKQLLQAVADLTAPRWLHTTGITLGLSESCRLATMDLLAWGKQGGARTSLDVNYRSKLWSAELASAACLAAFPSCDQIFIARRDASALFGVPEGAEHVEALRAIQRLAPHATVVMTLGELGAIGCDIEEPEPVHVGTRTVPVVDRLGGGDAFSAGCMCGWLRGDSFRDQLAMGNLLAAFKYSIPGDIAWVSPEEVARAWDGQWGNDVRR